MEYERQFKEAVQSQLGSAELAAWCREPQSRLCWPGAESIRHQGSVIYFTLNMQAPGGPPARGMMEEYLGAVHEGEAASEFESMLTLTWPSGEVGSGLARYRCAQQGDHSELAFELDYVLPRKLGVGRLHRDRFLGAVDRALSLYASRLANGPHSG